MDAARAEAAAAGGLAGFHRQHGACGVAPLQAARDGIQQCLGVGMAGRGQHLGRGAAFDHPAGVHHRDLVADPGDDGQVVADQDDGQAQRLVQVAQQVDDLALQRYIQ